MRPDRTPRLGFVPRLSALYIGIFIFSGIQMPFFPVWLKARDVDPAFIGVLLAVLIAPDQPYLTTDDFMSAIDAELRARIGAGV